MNTHDLPEQISELRWLVYELGHELQALSTTPYPHVHRFLIHTLAKKVAQVAEAACESASSSLLTPVVRHEVQPTLQSTAPSQDGRGRGREQWTSTASLEVTERPYQAPARGF
jgi:hypothetical protein